MKPKFIEDIERNISWEIPMEKPLYNELNLSFKLGTPQQKGIIVELVATTFLSRVFGRGLWLGTAGKYDCYDIYLEGSFIDIKSTELSNYDLSPSKKQTHLSLYGITKFHYLLASIESWNDIEASMQLRFHDLAVLENGVLREEYFFRKGVKRFNLKTGDIS